MSGGEIKTCPQCGGIFKQAHAPKAEQTFCSWACHQAARQGGLF